MLIRFINVFECLYHLSNNLSFGFFEASLVIEAKVINPLEGGRAQLAEWVNTAWPEFTNGLRVAKSPSSLLSFWGAT